VFVMRDNQMTPSPEMPSERQLMGRGVGPGAEMVAHALNLAVERAGSIIERMLRVGTANLQPPKSSCDDIAVK